MQTGKRWTAAAAAGLVLALAAMAMLLPGAARAAGPADDYLAVPTCVVEGDGCGSDYDSGGGVVLDDSSSLGFDATCSGSRYNQVWHLHRGTWPYNQETYLHFIWCGKGGRSGTITFRNMWTTHNGNLCSGYGDYAGVVSGGVGYSQITIEGGAYFTCPTAIPWIAIHKHRWMQIRFFPDGYSTAIAWG
jgi:hypothetical protein